MLSVAVVNLCNEVDDWLLARSFVVNNPEAVTIANDVPVVANAMLRGDDQAAFRSGAVLCVVVCETGEDFFGGVHGWFLPGECDPACHRAAQ